MSVLATSWGPPTAPVLSRGCQGARANLRKLYVRNCCSHVSILTPVVDPLDDPFEGRRPVRLPNGSWPVQVRLPANALPCVRQLSRDQAKHLRRSCRFWLRSSRETILFPSIPADVSHSRPSSPDGCMHWCHRPARALALTCTPGRHPTHNVHLFTPPQEGPAKGSANAFGHISLTLFAGEGHWYFGYEKYEGFKQVGRHSR